MRTKRLCAICAALAITLTSGSSCAATLTKKAVIDGVAQHYAQLLSLQSIDLECRIDCREVVQCSNSFAWDWMETRLRVKGSKVYADIRSPGVRRDGIKGEIFRTEASWNGTVGIQVETHRVPPDAKARERGAKITVTADAPDVVYRRQYYFHNVSFTWNEGFDKRRVARYRYPNGDYWLPNALVERGDQYRLLPKQEEAGGVTCHVLERPGYDRLYIDVNRGFAVIRREFRWAPKESLREVNINEMHKEVQPGLWLPFKCQRFYYCGPWEKRPGPAQVADHFVTTVQRLTVNTTDDSAFEQLDIPPYADGYDYRTDSYFSNFANADDPLGTTLEEFIRRSPTPPKGQWIWWGCLVVIPAIVAVGVVLILRNRYRRRPAARRL